MKVFKFFKRNKCEHEYWPVTYGRVLYCGEDIYAVIDECNKCGHRLIKTP